MQELLLLFSCINSIGCSETFGNYKYYNRSYVQNVEYIANEQLNRAPETVKLYVLPAAAAFVGGTGSVTLHKGLVLSVSPQGASLVLSIPLN